MRWFYIALIAVFAAAIILFALQNLQVVTVSFLGFGARAPLALLAVLIYLLGMATGSSMRAVLRRSIEEARRGGE
jgi:lipopolysaccharide assembly protein A